MYLHNNNTDFADAIAIASDMLDIEPAFVEKDYYAVLFLDLLSKEEPSLVFKGGTCLSKCHKVIDRFSEDIDITIYGDKKPTEGQRRHLKQSIVKVSEELGLNIVNLENTRSRRDFNRYEIDYHPNFSSQYSNQYLLIETSSFQPVYPIVQKNMNSYVSHYLAHEASPIEVLDYYHLFPFSISTISLERTFIDKTFALCDYYVRGEMTRNSRHIYDIHKIYPQIEMNDDFFELFERVRQDRESDGTCVSAAKDFSVSSTLKEIIKTDAYKSDYNRVTAGMIMDKTTYNDAIKTLKTVANKLASQSK